MADQRTDVVIGGAFEHCMLVDQTSRLTDPHRDTQFLPLRNGKVDVLHQDVQRRCRPQWPNVTLAHRRTTASTGASESTSATSSWTATTFMATASTSPRD